MTDDYDDVELADRVCDDDCRGANRCRGHGKCRLCGEICCGADLDDGLCAPCAERIAEEADA